MAKAFVTGSHAYGTPHVKSDIDLVVPMSEETCKLLMRLADNTPGDSEVTYLSQSLRFGNLNVIAALNTNEYRVWKTGTELLKTKAPVTRERAVACFKRLRKAFIPEDV